MKKTAFAGLFTVVIIGALLFRLPRLDLRPMHHDEANQAVKFGYLLENGQYRYDKTDHHGPSLYYLTLPFAWVSGKSTLASLDEKTLRRVPAVFGAGTILLFLLIQGGMKKGAVLFAGLFLALSPAVVYYSRFFIQETLLVFFVVGFLIASWRYISSPSMGWALVTGFFVGMMYATKETCVIAFGAAVFSGLLCLFFRKRRELHRNVSFLKRIGHVLAGLAAGFLVSWVLYSSFFQNSRGLTDSILSYGSYLVKAGQPEGHAHPWIYYLKMLFFSKSGSGPLWSEALILGLAVLGGVAVFTRGKRTDASRSFLRFIFFYTIITILIFSSVPYKTPWNLLPFYIGILLLAGEGTVFIFNSVKTPPLFIGAVLVLSLGILHLGIQSFRANFIFQTDPRNPYVFAQTSPDFSKLVQRVNAIAPLHPDGKNILIKVIANPYDTWPLPWDLRQFTRVGYWQEIQDAGNFEDVPLIITSLDKLDRLEPHIRKTHQSEFYGLRPNVLLTVHIRRDLWDKFLEGRK